MRMLKKMSSPNALREATTHSSRQRGVTLVEAILYLVVAASSIVLITNIVYNEQERQRDVVAANQLKIIVEQSQTFVAAEYDSVRRDLYEEAIAQADNRLARTYSMQDLVDRGYLPSSFLEAGAVENSFEQEYFLLVRGVDRSDGSTPKGTLLLGTTIPGESDWASFVSAHESPWLDPIPTAGANRFDIEAVILSSGGEPAPPSRGNRIAAATGISTAGYVQEVTPPTLAGAFNAYQYDISGFNILAEYPTLPPTGTRDYVGYVGGLVALSGLNDVFFGGGGDGDGGGSGPVTGTVESNFVFRCADPSNTDHPSQSFTYLYADCLNATEVYQDIVFADPAAVTNITAAIRRVQTIEMAGGDITGVEEITMNANGEITGDSLTIGGNNTTINMGGGTIDEPGTINVENGGTITGDNVTIDLGDGGTSGTINNVASLGFDCGTVDGSAGNLDIACDTLVNGTLDVTGETNLQANLVVGTDAEVRGQLRAGNTTGFSTDTLGNADIIAQSQIAVGDPPQDGTSFTPDVPGVLIEGNGADGGVVYANDFVIRDINSSAGGFSLSSTLVSAADITPNTSDLAGRIPIPECTGAPSNTPQSYPSVSAISSAAIIDTPLPAATPESSLAATPLADWTRYEDQPLLGYRYEQYGVTGAGSDVASTDPSAESWRFNIIGRFANLADPVNDPDPATDPVIELYLADTGSENRMFVITRCAPDI